MQIIPFILAALLGAASLLPGVGARDNDDERIVRSAEVGAGEERPFQNGGGWYFNDT